MQRTVARRWLAALLLTSALLNATPLWWGLPADPGWAFDEITPRNVAGAWPARYPPGHRYVLAGLYGPLESLYDAGLLRGDPYQGRFLAGRALSVLMATLTVLLAYRVARTLHVRRRGALLGAALLALGPTFVYYAKTANLDAPYLFWFALALLLFVRALRKRRAVDFALFAATGVFSFCTKDQAAFLYVLTPVALLTPLVAERARAGSARTRALIATLLDPRMLIAAAAALGTFALVYKGVFGAREFERHFELLTTADYEAGRQHANAIAGYASFTWQSVVNLWFVMSGPACLAAVVGLWLALVSKPRPSLMLAPLLLVVPYQIGLMVFVGLAYDRHLLPIALVAAVFGGVALDRLLSWESLPRALRRAAVAFVLILAFARAASFDAMMAADPRYSAEAWIEELDPETRIVGLGHEPSLPRGISTITHPFQPEFVGRIRLLPGAFHDCWTLRALDAEWIVPSHASQLEGPGVNYEPAKRFANPFANRLNRTGGAVTNLDKIPRNVTIWRRNDDPCLERSDIGRLLAALAGGSESWTSGTAQRAVAAGGPGRELGSNRMRVLRATRDLRTRGVDPIGILVDNRAAYPRSFELQLATAAPGDVYPIQVSIRGAAGTERHALIAPGKTWVSLPVAAPGGLELFVLSSDKEWINSARDPRLVGPKLTEAPGLVGERRAFLRELSGLADGSLEINPALVADSVLTAGRPWTEDLATAGLSTHQRLTTIAAVAARNPSEIDRAVDIRLGLPSPETPTPTIIALGGVPRRTSGGAAAMSAGGRTRGIRLGTVPAGTNRLFLLQPTHTAGPAPKLLELQWRPAETREALHRRMAELQTAGAAERDLFVREVRQGLYEGVSVNDSSTGSGSDFYLGASSDNWIGAAQPAGLVLTNPAQRTMAAWIDLVCPKAPAARGIRAFVDGGESVRSITCDQPGRIRVPIGTVGGGLDRLVLIWTDRTWSPGPSDPRSLAVQIPRVRWRRNEGDK